MLVPFQRQRPRANTDAPEARGVRGKFERRKEQLGWQFHPEIRKLNRQRTLDYAKFERDNRDTHPQVKEQGLKQLDQKWQSLGFEPTDNGDPSVSEEDIAKHNISPATKLIGTSRQGAIGRQERNPTHTCHRSRQLLRSHLVPIKPG